jgi:hypothetical protein
VNRYTALVRGPAAIFPRGFLWLIPVWYAGIAVLLVVKGRTPSWYTPAALAGLLVAAFSLLAVLATMRNNAFVADDRAIWLGLRAGATRRLGRRRKEVRRVPWPEIQQLRIVSRHYGAQVDILLGPAAPIVRRPNILGQIAAAVLLLIIPISCMGRSPGLVAARRNPPGYRVRLYDVTPGELGKALAALAPGTVQISEIRRPWVPRLRAAEPSPRLVPR